MGHRISKEFEDIPTYYWSDSSVTIAWIKSETQWGVFVWNRVSEIRRLTDSDLWFHVPGQQNPADLLSRGCSPKTLALSRWWEGPEWLKAPKSEWPICDDIPDEEVVMAEKKKGKITGVDVPQEINIAIASGVDIPQKIDTSIFSKYFSSYSRIVRLIGWILRFTRNSKKRRRISGSIEGRVREELSAEELNNAEKRLLRMIQGETFIGVNDKLISKLKPQQDSDKLLRICPRIWARKDTEDFRAPIILPPNNVIVERLIFEYHVKKGHIVAQALLNSLREKYWVIRGKQTVRRVVKKCVQCRRYATKKLEVEAPPLPEDRVRDARIFEIVGIDLAGPLYLRDGSNVWITLFTCAVYRAVHLDIASSLSTDEFLSVLRRFIARRGRPTVIYTDNGSNFKGASNMLNNVDWEKVAASDSVEPIDWRFNPPSAPWRGGFFERMIGLLKTLLKKNLGKASLTHEELYTVVCECESIINSRPITYVSDCPEELQAISPQMFIKEISEGGVPDMDQLDAAGLNRRLKYRSRLKEELRRRFRSEYLGQLILFSKECRNTRQPIVGEIALISSDNKKRLDWPLAIIEELIIGKDGKCRVVQLRTAEGRVVRPIQRIYPLEVFHVSDNTNRDADFQTPNTDEIEEENSFEATPTDALKYCQAETRCGRAVRLPVRYRQ